MHTFKIFKGVVNLLVLIALGVFLNINIAIAATDSVIIDVRTPGEYSQSHIKGALNIDIYSPQFRSQIEKLDKNKHYEVYCRSGSRSSQAVRIMKDMNFKKVTDRGGLGQIYSDPKLRCEGPSC